MQTFRRLTAHGRGEALLFLLGIAVLLSFPGLGASNRLVHLAVVTITYCIVAYGLYVSFGLFGQMTMALAAIWGVSCFAVALATLHWGWNFWLCLPLGVLAGGVAGFVASLPALRTQGHYFLVVTFAVAQLFVIAGNNWELVSNNHLGLLVPDYVQLGSINFAERANMLYLAGVLAIVVFAIVWAIQHSTFGRFAAAVRENEALAQSLGINVPGYKLVGLTLGGAIAGFAGAFHVYYTHSVQVEGFSVFQGIILVEILVLGGARHILGPLIGSAFVWLAPEAIGLEPLHGQILFGLVLVVVICAFPEGIAGSLGSLRLASGLPGLRKSQPAPEGTTEQVG